MSVQRLERWADRRRLLIAQAAKSFDSRSLLAALDARLLQVQKARLAKLPEDDADGPYRAATGNATTIRSPV